MQRKERQEELSRLRSALRDRLTDLRRVLNLGHTYGHALEEATGYRRFLHG